MRARIVVVTLVAAALTAVGGTSATAAKPGLGASAGARLARLPATAGPALLRAEPASAPQLENTGTWDAAPILVSGATAYREGEFLYQDWLFDDHGARGNVPGGLAGVGIGTAAATITGAKGSYAYPTDPVYANNAADLVEVRVEPHGSSTRLRVTLNTLVNPERTAFTVALGSSSSPQAYPFGANVSGPAQRFLTVHGATGVLTSPGSEEVVATAPVTVDAVRYQYDVAVPRQAWDPGNGVVRLAIGVGLWDTAAGRYLVPQVASDATRPGGSGTSAAPPAFFNVGFRQEPLRDGQLQNNWWDAAQATGLAANDMSAFFAEVDFGKLRAHEDDESAVPTTGYFSRIFASHFTLCGSPKTRCPAGERGRGIDPADANLQFLGELQPYSIMVPESKGEPFGLTLLLHASGTNYNEYQDTARVRQIVQRGTGAISLTTEGRGLSGGYAGPAMADLFEAWADLARWYPIDPTWTAASGTSMGAMGSFRVAGNWPDLLARIHPVVGYYDDPQAPSLRNVETLMWNGIADELVNAAFVELTVQRFLAAGLRFETDQFTSDHVLLSVHDSYGPAIDWLGDHRAPANPAHVTYVVDPAESLDAYGLDADHAYWLSGLRTRAEGLGTADAVSKAFGAGDPQPSGLQVGAGVVPGPQIPALAYVSQYQTWGETPTHLPEDRLVLNLVNIAEVTVDMARAGLSCAAALDVTTDGPVTVIRKGCGGRPLPFG